MALTKEPKFQIGKAGITSGVIESLNNLLRSHKLVRIATLKSSGRNRDSIKDMAEQIKAQLDTKYSYQSSIIGFTIILRRKLPKHAQ